MYGKNVKKKFECKNKIKTHCKYILKGVFYKV